MVAIASTMRAPGSFGATRASTRIATIVPTPMTTEGTFAVGMACTSSTSSRKKPSASTETAMIFSIWLTRTSIPRPVTKPTSTAFDRKFARNPSRSAQNSTKITPHRSVVARTSW